MPADIRERVLVIDPDRAALDSIARTIELRLPAVSVEMHEDGAEAVSRCRKVHYDTVLTDIELPGHDGFSVVHAFLAVQPMTPVVLMTTSIREELIRHARASGAHEVLCKPFDRDALVQTLRRAIAVHLMRIRLRDQDRTIASLLHRIGSLEQRLVDMARVNPHEATRRAVFEHIDVARAQAESAVASLREVYHQRLAFHARLRRYIDARIHAAIADRPAGRAPATTMGHIVGERAVDERLRAFADEETSEPA